MAHDDLPSTTRIAPARRGTRLTPVHGLRPSRRRRLRLAALALLILLLGLAGCLAAMHLRSA